MPGDPRDVGAHLDFAAEAHLYARTPSADKPRRAAIQVREGGGLAWHGGVTPVYGPLSYTALKYTWYAPPTLSRIWPVTGPVGGGTNVTVSGLGFEALPGLENVACRFGSAIAPAYFRNGSHVLCSTPPATASVQLRGRLRFALTLNAQDYHRSGDIEDPAGSFTFYRLTVRARAG